MIASLIVQIHADKRSEPWKKKHCLFYLLRVKQGLLEKTSFIDLVGGLEHFLFFHILGIIIPTDKSNSYFSEGWLNHQPEMNSPFQTSLIKEFPFQWFDWRQLDQRLNHQPLEVELPQDSGCAWYIWGSERKNKRWKINLWEPRQIRAPAEVLVG